MVYLLYIFQAADIIKANYDGKYKPIFKIDHSPIHRYIICLSFHINFHKSVQVPMLRMHLMPRP